MFEKDFEKICKAYPEIDWSLAGNNEAALFTGKVGNEVVVNLIMPQNQFVLHKDIMEKISNRHSFTGKTKWLIDNNTVLMSFEDNKSELGNILKFVSKDLKQYYIDKKKEEINAAKENYRGFTVSFCN